MARIKYMEAAGRQAKRGRPRLAVDDEMKARLMRLYIEEGLSVRDIAAELGIPEANVRRRLRAAKIPMRTNAPRSRLRKLDQAQLFADLHELGPERTAEKWGVPRSTFFDYLARIRSRASNGIK